MAQERQSFYGKESLFDILPENSKLTAKEARKRFDGTIFSGLSLVRIDFTEDGQVEIIHSCNASTLEEFTQFKPGDSGGWNSEDEGGFYGETTVLGKRLNSIVSAIKEEWQLWKETEAEHLGVDFRTWKADRIEVMVGELEQREISRDEKLVQYANTTRQRYHDYYVKRFLAGELPEDDMANYYRAMEWEKEGFVRPYDPKEDD